MVKNLLPSPYSILITDDDQTFRRTVRDIISQRGFRALEAACGEEAIEIVQDEHVHLALFDMHMPTLTGLETMRIVKRINAVLPCIIVSADATGRLMQEALSAQAFTVLTKPVSAQMILRTVDRALRKIYPGSGRLPDVEQWIQ